MVQGSVSSILPSSGSSSGSFSTKGLQVVGSYLDFIHPQEAPWSLLLDLDFRQTLPSYLGHCNVMLLV